MFELNKIYQMDCLEYMDGLIKQGIKVDAIITDLPYGTTANYLGKNKSNAYKWATCFS